MERVVPIELRKGMSANELVGEYKKAGVLNAGNLARAVDIYEAMLRENATVFLGLSGALVPGGMRKLIRDMIDEGMVDVIVSTGANLVHDMIESFAGGHYKGSCTADDLELKKKEINRIYDIFLPEDHYTRFGEGVGRICREIASSRRGPMSTSEFFKEFGSRVEDRGSIIRTAYERKVPIFCPAVADSEFGLGIAQDPELLGSLVLDTFADVSECIGIAKKAEKSGAVILGGGVPKNFIFQVMVPGEMKKKRGGHDYVIQITLDRPETGGLSGATLEEAVSWTKIKGRRNNRAVVVAEVSTVLPLILAALKERIAR